MQAFFLLTLAVAVSMLIIPMAWRIAPRIGMVDLPDPRKVHTAPIPRIGGWGITLGSIVPLVLLHRLDPLLQSFIAGSLVLFLFGLWDDARQIGHWAKFSGQIIAVAIVVFHGDLYITRLPFVDGEILAGLPGQLFTMVALIGVINAINHSDGLDGLAGGESVLSLVAIAFLGHLAGSELVVHIALTTIGGTLGFLRYNTHPAKVFMGDSGSQFLGFALGFLVIYLVQVANPAASAALPLLLLGLPITDILAVLYQRARGGMNWFKATRNHVHHRLLDLGFTHYESVVSIYSLQAALVVSGVVLRYQSDLLVTAVYLLAMAGLFAALLVAERRGWRLGQEIHARVLRFPDSLQRLTRNAWVRRSPLWFISATVPLFMCLAGLWVADVPRDFGAIALVIAVALAVDMVRGKTVGSLIVRTAVYVAAAFSAYLFIRNPGVYGAETTHWVNLLMIALAVALGIFIRFLSERKFGTTPTDYLIVLGVVALAMFDRLDIQTGGIIPFVSYAIVLFYGCEVIVGHVARWRYVLGWPTLAALLILAGRGLGGLI